MRIRRNDAEWVLGDNGNWLSPVDLLIKEQIMAPTPKKPQPDIPQPPDIQPEKPDIQREPRPEEIPPAPDVPEKESPPMSV